MHAAVLALLALAVSAGALLGFMASPAREPGPGSRMRPVQQYPHPAQAPPRRARSSWTLTPALTGERVTVRLQKALRSGVLFDVRSGRVLWQQNPTRLLPIASLTKMMTALVTVARSRPDQKFLITSAATHYTGSGVGLLPLGKRVSRASLLYGLLLPSGDAAIALAQGVAGNQPRFIGLMNARRGRWVSAARTSPLCRGSSTRETTRARSTSP